MSSQSPSAPLAPPCLPLAVQVGFAGARRLWPEGAAVDAEAFERALAQQLKAALQRLPQALGLDAQHFLVGLSQVAAGADMLFTEVIAELGWGQRVFLPQLREDYLAAQGSQGPDFTPAEAARARALLALPHIIEERVVTTAAERVARFDDTNLHILAEADVLVCLQREGQVGKPGGTQQLLKRAQARGVKVLKLCVSMTAEGLPRLVGDWEEGAFKLPALPSPVQSDVPVLHVYGNAWPQVQAYAQALKTEASTHAGERRSSFERASLIIIGTHVLATLLAALAMDFLANLKIEVKVVLGAELLLLGWGYVRHWQLHHDKHTEDWALARLCAELARSVLAFGRLPGSLAHLLALPIPASMQPLMRTLNVLQLRQLREGPQPEWSDERDRYVGDRLGSLANDQPPGAGTGQLGYYERQRLKAERLLFWANGTFKTLSALAIAATLMKLALKSKGIDGMPIQATGLAAVVLPVMAVAAMSLVAALDAQARAHTFEEMREFLQASKRRLTEATSPREAVALAAEAETRLFGETLLWYSRRAYTSVA